MNSAPLVDEFQQLLGVVELPLQSDGWGECCWAKLYKSSSGRVGFLCWMCVARVLSAYMQVLLMILSVQL